MTSEEDPTASDLVNEQEVELDESAESDDGGTEGERSKARVTPPALPPLPPPLAPQVAPTAVAPKGNGRMLVGVVAFVVLLAVAIGGGVKLASALRAPPPAASILVPAPPSAERPAPPPSASAPHEITIPTIDFSDPAPDAK